MVCCLIRNMGALHGRARAACFQEHRSGAAAAGPNVRVMIAAWPLVHQLIGFGISTLATYATLLVALAFIDARGEGTEVHNVSPLLLAVHLQGSPTYARWPIWTFMLKEVHRAQCTSVSMMCAGTANRCAYFFIMALCLYLTGYCKVFCCKAPAHEIKSCLVSHGSCDTRRVCWARSRRAGRCG